jgi:hypothetical protein
MSEESVVSQSQNRKIPTSYQNPTRIAIVEARSNKNRGITSRVFSSFGSNRDGSLHWVHYWGTDVQVGKKFWTRQRCAAWWYNTPPPPLLVIVLEHRGHSPRCSVIACLYIITTITRVDTRWEQFIDIRRQLCFSSTILLLGPANEMESNCIIWGTRPSLLY